NALVLKARRYIGAWDRQNPIELPGRARRAAETLGFSDQRREGGSARTSAVNNTTPDREPSISEVAMTGSWCRGALRRKPTRSRRSPYRRLVPEAVSASPYFLFGATSIGQLPVGARFCQRAVQIAECLRMLF